MANSNSYMYVPKGIVAITPHATNNLAKPIRGFMVGAAGNVAVVMADGTTGTIPGCQAGIRYDGNIHAVRVTGTTATGIVGFY